MGSYGFDSVEELLGIVGNCWEAKEYIIQHVRDFKMSKSHEAPMTCKQIGETFE